MSISWILVALLVAAIAGFVLEKRRRRTAPVAPGHQADLTFPHEAEWELYHNALSLCSMKTRLCLAELRIPYRGHHVDLIETGRYETLRPRLLTVNPAGTVPVLLHHGHPIYESHEQIRYAARFTPEDVPSLVPGDPGDRAEMEAWIDRSSLTDPLEHPERSAGNAIPAQTLPLFCTMIEKIPAYLILEGLLFHFDKQRPLLFLMLKLRGIHRMPGIRPIVRAIAQTREHLHGFLDELESRLKKTGGPWIMGEQYTLADVGWLVLFERMRQASCENVFLERAERPRVADYWERLKARPAYEEAILQHDHPLIDHGRRRIAEAKASDPRVREMLEGA